MSTWDSMSDADYAACVDAGRSPGEDPKHRADEARKERQENGESRDISKEPRPNCGKGNINCRERLKFNGGNLFCVGCGRDGVQLGVLERPRLILDVVKTDNGYEVDERSH